MKSKYNTGKPIDISELTDAERKQAFHEWAEGSQALEQLLNVGYERGFFSHACCGGDTGRPYISYKLNDDQSKKIAMYIAKQLIASDLDCRINFDNDFHYTEEEYKEIREHLLRTFPEDFSEEQISSTRSISQLNVQTRIENREVVFGAMAKSIKEVELDKVKLPQTEEEIPTKDFKRTSEETRNNRTTDNNFVAELESKTYTQEEMAMKIIDSTVTKQPVVQAHVTKRTEKVI